MSLLDLKKLPEDTIQMTGFTSGSMAPLSALPPPATSSGDGAGGVPAGSVAPTAMPVEPEEDLDEANMMGLPEPANPKAKAKAKAVKRSRAEMVQDEVNKLDGEWNALVALCNQFPTSPTPTQVGRLDRMISKKIASLKDSFDFEAAGHLAKLQQKIEVFRQGLKSGISYLTGTLATRKRHADEYHTRMEAFQTQLPDIFNILPATAKNAFEELRITKLLDADDWATLETIFRADALSASNVDAPALLEKVLCKFMKDVSARSAEEMNDKVANIGMAMSNVLHAVCHSSTEEIKAAATAVAACVSRKPLPGQNTLEEPLSLLMSSSTAPIFRIMHEHAVGTMMLKAASQENQQLIAKHDKQLSLAEWQHTLTSLKDDVKAFAEDPGEDLAKLEKTINDIEEKSKLILSLCEPGDFNSGRGKEAVAAFCAVAECALQTIWRRCLRYSMGFAKIFVDDTAIDVHDAYWVSLVSDASLSLKNLLSTFCSAGESFKLIQKLIHANQLPEDSQAAFQTGRDVQIFARQQGGPLMIRGTALYLSPEGFEASQRSACGGEAWWLSGGTLGWPQ
eukprot:Skav205766  [mRNA]  locus=scaffold1714:427407:433961:- [translate_table: standard]